MFIQLLAPLAYMFFCHNQNLKHRENDQLQCVTVLAKFAIPDNKGETQFLENRSIIYSYQDLIMYILYDDHQIIHSDGSIITDKWEHYFIFQKDSSYGINFDPHRQEMNKRLPVDSAVQSVNLQNGLNVFAKSAHPKKVITDKKKNTRIELYSFKSKEIPSKNDSAYLYFDGNVRIPFFSLSSVLDSSRKMKLFKVRIVNPPFYFQKEHIKVQRRETLFQLNTIPVSNEEFILGYFNRYKRKSGSNRRK